MANMVPEALFGDDDWDLLITDIEQRNVVPVVGPDLLIRGSDCSQTLHQYLASELIQRLQVRADYLSSNIKLLDICSANMSRGLSDTILKVMRVASWPLPLPLAQLAQITGFDLYVSTTFDSLLYDAVRRNRVATVNCLYGLKRPVQDVDIDISTGRLRTTVVFQIFGHLDRTEDCALSEEQVLQFAQRLQDPDPGHRPKFLFDTLARRNLLFLGCGFPGWLGRFFRRVLKGCGELNDRGVFAHSFLTEDPGYVLFLERQGAKLWPEDSGVRFVNELHRRWYERHPPESKPEAFISYAREDEDVAKDLTELLERAGASVWLDQDRLRSGEIWNDDVVIAIQDSRVFIPVISRHSARANPRYCHKEWDLASGMPGKRICPLCTDATPLPAAFADRHARPLANKDELVRDIVEFLQDTRKRQAPL
jgi:hypothetical protein